jgi:hypothetical protein
MRHAALVCVMGMLVAACATTLGQGSAADYRLVLDVEVVQAGAQLAQGVLDPVHVRLRNEGSGEGTADVECTMGPYALHAELPVRTWLNSVAFTLPRDVTLDAAPRGRQHLTCTARVRDVLAARAVTLTEEVVIPAPQSPDLSLAADRYLPPAFDCDNRAPPVATRPVCAALDVWGDVTTSHRLACSLDGAALPGGALRPQEGDHTRYRVELEHISAGDHRLRCSVTLAPVPAYETNLANNAVDISFHTRGDVGDWRYDVAIDAIEGATRVVSLPPPVTGPPGSTPPPYVSMTGLGVRIRNAGQDPIMAVDVHCRARAADGRGDPIVLAGATFKNADVPALRAGDVRDVLVGTRAPLPAGQLALECDARVRDPAGVSDRDPANNVRTTTVLHQPAVP